MALLIWTMVGLALWHFTVFLPDNFWGGIVARSAAPCSGRSCSGCSSTWASRVRTTRTS